MIYQKFNYDELNAKQCFLLPKLSTRLTGSPPKSVKSVRSARFQYMNSGVKLQNLLHSPNPCEETTATHNPSRPTHRKHNSHRGFVKSNASKVVFRKKTEASTLVGGKRKLNSKMITKSCCKLRISSSLSLYVHANTLRF